MNNAKKWLIQCTQLLAEVSLLSGFYSFILHRQYGTGEIRTGGWILLLLLCFGGNLLLRQTEASVKLTVILSGVCMLGAVLFSGRIIHTESPSLLMRIFAAGTLAATALHASVLPEDTPAQRTLVLYLDGLIVNECFLLWMASWNPPEFYSAAIAWGTAAAAASLLALVLFRTETIRPSMLMVWILLAAGCVLALWAGFHLQTSASHAARALIRLGTWCMQLARTTGIWILRGIAFLIRLLPGEEEKMNLPPVPESVPQMQEAIPEDIPMDGEWLAALAVFALGVLVFRLWHRLHGLRWKRLEGGAGTGSAGRRRHLLWKDGWKGLAEKIRFEWKYLRFRNTAAGLLTFTERHTPAEVPGRGRGESAHGFIRRLSEKAEPSLRVCGSRLADVLEREFYSRSGSGVEEGKLPAAFCREYRKNLLRAGRAGDHAM